MSQTIATFRDRWKKLKFFEKKSVLGHLGSYRGFGGQNGSRPFSVTLSQVAEGWDLSGPLRISHKRHSGTHFLRSINAQIPTDCNISQSMEKVKIFWKKNQFWAIWAHIVGLGAKMAVSHFQSHFRRQQRDGIWADHSTFLAKGTPEHPFWDV